MVDSKATGLHTFWGSEWAPKVSPMGIRTTPSQKSRFLSQTRLNFTKGGKLLIRPLRTDPFSSPAQYWLPPEVWRHIIQWTVTLAVNDCNAFYASQVEQPNLEPREYDFYRDVIIAFPITPLYEKVRFANYQVHSTLLDTDLLIVYNDEEFQAWLEKNRFFKPPMFQPKGLGEVCRLWRQIAVHEWRLWEELHLLLDQGTMLGSQAIHQWFTNAGTHPVHLLLMAKTTERLPPSSVLHACHKHISQLKGLTVSYNFVGSFLEQFNTDEAHRIQDLFTSWAHVMDAGISLEFPHFTSLHVNMLAIPLELHCFGHGLCSWLNSFAQVAATSLKRISWSTYLIDATPVFFRPSRSLLPGIAAHYPQLTHANIAYLSEDDLIFLLIHAPVLVECIVHVGNAWEGMVVGMEDLGITDFPCILSHLQTLQLNASDGSFSPNVFRVVICPSLKDLRLGQKRGLVAEEFHTLFEAFLLGSLCPLERLELKQFIALDGEYLTQILAIPSINSSLCHFEIQEDWMDNAETFVNFLSIPMCLNLPNLNTLKLECLLSPTSTGSVKEMVASRLNGAAMVTDRLCVSLQTFLMHGFCKNCHSGDQQQEAEIEAMKGQTAIQFFSCQ